MTKVNANWARLTTQLRLEKINAELASDFRLREDGELWTVEDATATPRRLKTVIVGDPAEVHEAVRHFHDGVFVAIERVAPND
jgi:alkanesulfonate monooxygenase SsuD/methylene tetrahydromethanopterin reductase-like flavin-dependent oxidoreductase (luciferase family)